MSLEKDQQDAVTGRHLQGRTDTCQAWLGDLNWALGHSGEKQLIS